MRTRKHKTIDGKSYEKVDTSRFFKVKARSIKNALAKLEFIHTKEIKDMFRNLTVDTILADRREARVNLTYREGVEQEISFPIKITVPTQYKETGDFGFQYPKFTPCNFIQLDSVDRKIVPTVGWID